LWLPAYTSSLINPLANIECAKPKV
jgi:hypothetical protein